MSERDGIDVSRRIDVVWDSEKHELIIMGRRFKPADPDATPADLADDAKEVFYALTDMNRRVMEVEDWMNRVREFSEEALRVADRQLLIDVIRERDAAKSELSRLRQRNPSVRGFGDE